MFDWLGIFLHKLYYKLAKLFAEYMHMQIWMYVGMWVLYFILYLLPTIDISLLSVGHWLIHRDSAILSSAGYLSKGLIRFWFLSLSLPLLSFSLWFKQNTSVSQAVNLSLFMSAKYTRGKKQFITFSQLRKTGWLRRLVMSLDTEVTDTA